MIIDNIDQDLCDVLFYSPEHDGKSNTFRDKGIPPGYHFVIEMTQNCNLRCKYCSSLNAKHDLDDNLDLSIDTADQLILFIKGLLNPDDIVTLSFYGGEPLLNFDVMKYITEEFVNLNVRRGSISLTTNLTLLNDEIIDFFNKYNVKVLISFDGYQENHDFNRVFPNGKGTFDVVLSNIKKLYENIIDINNITFNCVVSPNTQVPKLIEFFNTMWFTRIDKGVFYQNVSLSFIRNYDTIHSYKQQYFSDIQNNCGSDYNGLLNSIDVSGYSKRSTGEDVPSFSINMWKRRIEKIMVMLYGHINDYSVFDNLCEICKQGFYVSFNGDFKICHYLNNDDQNITIGNVSQGINKERSLLLYSLSVEMLSDCNYCWNKRFCSPCIASMYDNGKREINKEFFKMFFCEEEKELTKAIINDIFRLTRTNPMKLYELLNQIGEYYENRKSANDH
ncbi:MAG: radical SAM protein [Candidatus Cloacimonetes bacterium]|nr:radical SAM protein [Candidatus Cloacimonadota bacterium]